MILGFIILARHIMELGHGACMKPKPESFKRNDILRIHIAHIDLGAEFVHQQNLLGFERCLENEVGLIDLLDDFFYKSRTYFTGSEIEPDDTTFTPMADDFPGAGFEVGFDLLHPALWGNDFLRVFTADLRENDELFGESPNVVGLFLARQVDDSGRDFDISHHGSPYYLP